MKTVNEMDARELAEHAKRNAPECRFAYSKDGCAVGWFQAGGFKQALASTIMPDMRWIHAAVGTVASDEWIEV